MSRGAVDGELYCQVAFFTDTDQRDRAADTRREAGADAATFINDTQPGVCRVL